MLCAVKAAVKTDGAYIRNDWNNKMDALYFYGYVGNNRYV